LLRAALERLGVTRLVLAVHDASFPADRAEDTGRGTPYGRGARRLFEFAAAHGFDGVQFGPQGKVSLANPSPYDGAVMARAPLSVALGPLVDEPGLAGLIRPEELARATAHVPRDSRKRAQHRHAWEVVAGGLRVAHRRYRAAPQSFPALAEASRGFFARNDDWLEADDLFEALVATHHDDDVAAWPELDRSIYHLGQDRERRARSEARKESVLQLQADTVALNRFTQLLLHVQHARLRAALAPLQLRLYADFQVGLSVRDRWRVHSLLLPGYALGAPPSRTNREGQAWGYPVLDPQFLHGRPSDPLGSPGLDFFDRRLTRLFGDFDGVRIDHPHGLITPWIYRSAGGHNDAELPAVRAGARLYDSPSVSDHAELERYAIATLDDLAPESEGRARYADDWVRHAGPGQLERYALLMDRVMAIALRHGADHDDVCAEVLSTCPFPVARVLERHGLGRVRVVQKANPDDLGDPYRSENAAPPDWITLGTHDTQPIAPVLDAWLEGEGGARAGAWARYLGQRLFPGDGGFAAELGRDRRALLNALTADLFLGPAQHVSIFFADFFGLRDTYNMPGTVDPANWTLRVPEDFAEHHTRELAAGDALDLRAALALALRARARGQAGDMLDLSRALQSG
jgi:4-alpha-glucanotransferase